MISETEIIEIVSDALGVDKDTVNINTQSSDLPEWDSLGHLSILSNLQQKLDERYQENQELASAVSVKSLLDCLNKVE